MLAVVLDEILLSDHGFHPDSLRPSVIPVEPTGPAVEHRRYGILALAGDGLKRDERITGATLLDLCPTILTLFGLPVGRDMDGKVLVNAWQIFRAGPRTLPPSSRGSRDPAPP